MTSSAFTPISAMSQIQNNQLQLNNRVLTNTSSGSPYLYDPISFHKSSNGPPTPQNPLDLNKSSQAAVTVSVTTPSTNSGQAQENAPPQVQSQIVPTSFAVNNHLISLHQIRSYQQHPSVSNSNNGAQNSSGVSLDHGGGMMVGGGPLKDKN